MFPGLVRCTIYLFRTVRLKRRTHTQELVREPWHIEMRYILGTPGNHLLYGAVVGKNCCRRSVTFTDGGIAVFNHQLADIFAARKYSGVDSLLCIVILLIGIVSIHGNRYGFARMNVTIKNLLCAFLCIGS